jgi:Holliday junction resolvase RusA-like endonuclease
MKLIIQGRPVPAVRMTQRSKYKSIQAKRYLDYKELIGWEAKAAGCRPNDKKYYVAITVFISPKGHDMDVDNLAKSYLDGLNKIAWNDDRQVVSLRIDKYYHADEKAEILITEVTP